MSAARLSKSCTPLAVGSPERYTAEPFSVAMKYLRPPDGCFPSRALDGSAFAAPFSLPFAGREDAHSAPPDWGRVAPRSGFIGTMNFPSVKVARVLSVAERSRL